MILFEITPANEAMIREKLDELEKAISDLIDAKVEEMLGLVTVTQNGAPLVSSSSPCSSA